MKSFARQTIFVSIQWKFHSLTDFVRSFNSTRACITPLTVFWSFSDCKISAPQFFYSNSNVFVVGTNPHLHISCGFHIRLFHLLSSGFSLSSLILSRQKPISKCLSSDARSFLQRNFRKRDIARNNWKTISSLWKSFSFLEKDQ